jgi:hypothetical protein
MAFFRLGDNFISDRIYQRSSQALAEEQRARRSVSRSDRTPWKRGPNKKTGVCIWLPLPS